MVETEFGEPEVKMSTYLVCFIVCDFKYVEGFTKRNIPVSTQIFFSSITFLSVVALMLMPPLNGIFGKTDSLTRRGTLFNFHYGRKLSKNEVSLVKYVTFSFKFNLI